MAYREVDIQPKRETTWEQDKAAGVRVDSFDPNLLARILMDDESIEKGTAR